MNQNQHPILSVEGYNLSAQNATDILVKETLQNFPLYAITETNATWVVRDDLFETIEDVQN